MGLTKNYSKTIWQKPSVTFFKVVAYLIKFVTVLLFLLLTLEERLAWPKMSILPSSENFSRSGQPTLLFLTNVFYSRKSFHESKSPTIVMVIIILEYTFLCVTKKAYHAVFKPLLAVNDYKYCRAKSVSEYSFHGTTEISREQRFNWSHFFLYWIFFSFLLILDLVSDIVQILSQKEIR